MKRFGILFCFGLLSCEGGASKISNLEIVEESSSLGEYLQMESSTSLITVKRESPGGLVRVRTQDKSIEILDPDALQAKDIFFSQGRIAYRLGNAIRIWSEGKIAELPVVAAKLRGFQVSSAGLRLAWD
ncbi:MAG TPA: hypothetical protein PLU50_07485, partial [Pseudobdellovibrionaceae bacterium]|nr:hypothetical protein [Pseudobdellovibrionaceae bacterium]